jgi:hypothetical protein
VVYRACLSRILSLDDVDWTLGGVGGGLGDTVLLDVAQVLLAHGLCCEALLACRGRVRQLYAACGGMDRSTEASEGSREGSSEGCTEGWSEGWSEAWSEEWNDLQLVVVALAHSALSARVRAEEGAVERTTVSATVTVTERVIEGVTERVTEGGAIVSGGRADAALAWRLLWVVLCHTTEGLTDKAAADAPRTGAGAGPGAGTAAGAAGTAGAAGAGAAPGGGKHAEVGVGSNTSDEKTATVCARFADVILSAQISGSGGGSGGGSSSDASSLLSLKSLFAPSLSSPPSPPSHIDPTAVAGGLVTTLLAAFGPNNRVVLGVLSALSASTRGGFGDALDAQTLLLLV